MATQLQSRRGTTAQMNAFTGAEGEIAVNTSTDTLHVHDGSTAGGHALAKADGSNIATYAGSFTTLAASGATTLSSTLAVTGVLTATSLDISGDIDVDGVANLDVVDIDGAVGMASTLNVTGAATLTSTLAVTGEITAGSALTTGAIASTAVDGTVLDRSGNTSRFVAGRSGGNYAALEMHVAGASGVTKRFSIDYDSTTKLFAPNGTSEHLVVTSAGNVGIGQAPSTFSNWKILELKGGTAGAMLNFENSSSTRVSSLAYDDGSDSLRIQNFLANPITFETSNTERMRIGSTGIIYVNGDGTGGRISGDGSGGLNLQDGNGRQTFKIMSPSSGSVQAMTLDASSNLLVGKTSTSYAVEGITLRADNAGVQSTVTDEAPFTANRLNSDGRLFLFAKDTTTVGSIGNDSNNLYVVFSQTNNIGLAGGGPATIFPVGNNGAVRDNAIDLGYASGRFDDIFATNGTIQTSDRNEKQDIEALSDAEQRVAVAAKGLLRKFRWISSVEENGDDARIHFGIIAQDLQDAFTAEGLDAGRYAMFISSTWTDEDGNEQTRLGVRYSELLAFIIAAI